MPTTIVMPQLGESVAEGVIGKWLKNEGDSIAQDEPIVEIITDKVNAEIPSPVAGVLERISQPEGATVAVGQEIAIIGDGDGSSHTPAAEASIPEDSEPSGGNGQGPGGRSATEYAGASAPSPVATATHGRADRVRSSPLVRRLAEQHGISLAEVPGTGIGGRVSKHDILAFVAQREEQQTAAPAAVLTEQRPAAQAEAPPAPPVQPAYEPIAAEPVSVGPPSVGRDREARPSGSGYPLGARRAPQPQISPSEDRIPISPLRKMIADRMVLSWTTIPHAATISEVDMTNVVRYRDARKDQFRQREGVPLSLVAFVIKATVEALREYPLVNSQWGEGEILLKKDLNLNVAVDAPDGLITPVIHHADDRSLAGLSKAITDLAERARAKKLRVEDMQGGTFTVNNTGALGSLTGVSIINHPQAAILAAGTVVKRPVVLEQDGQDLIAVRSMMQLSFSFDHRIMDGGYATGFVARVKEVLENWPADYPLY